MNVINLTDAVIRGDMWSQVINISMDSQDFTDVTPTATLIQNGRVVSGVTPVSTRVSGGVGIGVISVTLTSTHTSTMNPGAYSVRVRISTSSWGPYTILTLNFNLIN